MAYDGLCPASRRVAQTVVEAVVPTAWGLGADTVALRLTKSAGGIYPRLARVMARRLNVTNGHLTVRSRVKECSVCSLPCVIH
jgi:CRP-like cAMP-binding protein